MKCSFCKKERKSDEYKEGKKLCDLCMQMIRERSKNKAKLFEDEQVEENDKTYVSQEKEIQKDNSHVTNVEQPTTLNDVDEREIPKPPDDGIGERQKAQEEEEIPEEKPELKRQIGYNKTFFFEPTISLKKLSLIAGGILGLTFCKDLFSAQEIPGFHPYGHIQNNIFYR
jgi:hypothetical protein